MNSRKKLMLILLITTGLIILFFLTHERNHTDAQNKESQNAPVNKKIIEISSVSNLEKQNNSNLVAEKKINAHPQWKPLGDEASAAKVRNWFATRGTYSFYGPEHQDDYQNYDRETLEKLSNSGDIHAMHILSDRSSTVDESKSILDRAAVYGSTEALAQIGAINEIKNKIHQKTPEERKPIILESLAYYEAAQMRGDWWVKIQRGESLLSRYPTEITQKDSAYIQNRGKEIYENLQKQRTELGLGEFDNSVPDEVMKFYEEMLRPL